MLWHLCFARNNHLTGLTCIIEIVGKAVHYKHVNVFLQLLYLASGAWSAWLGQMWMSEGGCKVHLDLSDVLGC